MQKFSFDTLGGMLNPFLDYLQRGFDTVNAWQGILVAIVAAWFMKSWRQLLPSTLIASLVYILFEHFWPIVTRGARLRLPDVTEGPFWQRLGAVYVGLLIIVAIFFAVKSAYQKARGGGGAPKKA